MYLIHRVEKKAFIDWAEQTIKIIDKNTGEIREAYVFIGTFDRLSDIKDMLDAYRRQLEQTSILKLSFEERFSLLVYNECTGRRNQHLQRLLKQAYLRIAACLEDIDYNSNKDLDRK